MALKYARAVHDSAAAKLQYFEKRLHGEEIRLQMLRDAKEESSGRLRSAKRQLARVRQEFYEQGVCVHAPVPQEGTDDNDSLMGFTSADSRSPSPVLPIS